MSYPNIIDKDFVPTPPEGFRLLNNGERIKPGDLRWTDSPPVFMARRGEEPHWVEFAISGDWGRAEDGEYYCRAIDETKVNTKFEFFEGKTIDVSDW